MFDFPCTSLSLLSVVLARQFGMAQMTIPTCSPVNPVQLFFVESHSFNSFFVCPLPATGQEANYSIWRQDSHTRATSFMATFANNPCPYRDSGVSVV